MKDLKCRRIRGKKERINLTIKYNVLQYDMTKDHNANF